GPAAGASGSGAGSLTSSKRLGWLPGNGKGGATGRGAGRAPSSATGGGVVAAEGVGSAVDGILSTIRGELATGDLMVVWLLDASLSLYDDRQQVAARIEPFYRDLEARRGSSHQLMNAAVAYGGSTLELVSPTKFGLKMVEAVADTPIDTTGLENVMTAIEQCVRKYRKSWRGGILIVVWTDESGDDTLRLEDMIAFCRQQRVVVSVVGPSSAFGSEMGVHPYVDRATGYRFLLPIKRGPDTSFAERLLLAYWHDSTLPPWTLRGAQVGGDVPWYGGPYREGLLSGVGPYALTRLALETGGKYTLLDHDFSRAPFKFEDLKAYLPDYGSADEYLRMLRYHPLRKAVSDVVQLSYDQQQVLSLPKLSFISRRSESYPFRVHNLYLTAGEFRGALTGEFAAETAKLSLASTVLEQALSRFGAAGMEQQYERDDSPRWRAWYDLTRGRLLSMSVRHVEYKLTCQQVFANAGMLNPDTNHIVFEPSPQLKSTDSEVLKRAAEAKRLLQRCVDKNPDTPWAFLAQWELDQPLGLSVRQTVIPVPRPGIGRPAAPVPSLPNL
ncbi:MAG TPA: VWA domain-containing protein, partial [Pirellulales bacterium]